MCRQCCSPTKGMCGGSPLYCTDADPAYSLQNHPDFCLRDGNWYRNDEEDPDDVNQPADDFEMQCADAGGDIAIPQAAMRTTQAKSAQATVAKKAQHLTTQHALTPPTAE